MTKIELTAELKAAVEALYVARRDRQAHPEGKFDRQGRWYPSEEEDADGYSAGLRTPSRSWLYSLMNGARTKKHITALALSNPEFVLREAAPFLPAAELANAAD